MLKHYLMESNQLLLHLNPEHHRYGDHVAAVYILRGSQYQHPYFQLLKQRSMENQQPRRLLPFCSHGQHQRFKEPPQKQTRHPP
jgi:hypothetical protein